MRYYINFIGSILLKDEPTNKQKDAFESRFGKDGVKISRTESERWLISLVGEFTYPGDEAIQKMFDCIAPSTLSGDVRFWELCQDIWKYEYNFRIGSWEKQQARIIWNRKEAYKVYPPISNDLGDEFVGQVVDIFEDFLGNKGVKISSDDSDGAIIIGRDYDKLAQDIKDILQNWDILPEE